MAVSSKRGPFKSKSAKRQKEGAASPGRVKPRIGKVSLQSYSFYQSKQSQRFKVVEE